VNSNDLTAAQLRAVAVVAGRGRDYLTKLMDRMRELKFPADDPLVVAASRARDGMSNLTVVASSTAARRENVMERKPWAG
jgi:hypothetical protein